jgi:hypothetical protein
VKTILVTLIGAAGFIALGLIVGVVGEDQLRAIGADLAKQHGYNAKGQP